jgi:predicted RNase H-like nuclease (RuvC/YqgF family)
MPRSKKTKSVGVQVDEAEGASTGDAVKDFLRATAAFGGEAVEEAVTQGKLSELCPEDKAKVAKLIRQVVEMGQEVRRLQGELGSCGGSKRELEERVGELDRAQEKQAEQQKTLTKENAKLRKKLTHTLDLIRKYQSRFEELSAKESMPGAGRVVSLRDESTRDRAASTIMPATEAVEPEVTARCPSHKPLPDVVDFKCRRAEPLS